MASVKAADFPRFLAGGWKAFPAVLIFGSDEGAVRETASKLAAAALGPHADPLNLVTLDGGDIAQDPARLADELRTFGLFGGFRLVHVRGAGRVPPAAVDAAASEPAEGALLLLEAGDLKAGTGLRGFCEKHRRVAVLPCYADTGRALAQLIDDVAGSNGMTVTREAREALLACLGADRALSRAEMDKLVLFAQGATEIDAEMVAAIISDAGRHETSALIDNAFTGRIDDIEPEANRIFAAGTHPSAVLTQAIAHAFLLRRALRAAGDGGGTADALARANRLHFSRIPALERAMNLWGEERLSRALAGLAEAVRQTRLTARLSGPIAIRALWATARLSRSRS